MYCGQGSSRSNTRVSPTNWPLLSLQAAEARSMVRLEPHDGSISAYYRRYGMPSPLPLSITLGRFPRQRSTELTGGKQSKTRGKSRKRWSGQAGRQEENTFE
ncbi:hypothetical protein V8C44DRAFT_299765 [Trichoderma aethiopicum]